jgi:hypothetical protein
LNDVGDPVELVTLVAQEIERQGGIAVDLDPSRAVLFERIPPANGPARILRSESPPRKAGL